MATIVKDYKNVIDYHFDPETNKIVGVKINVCDPQLLPTLAQLATIHIPCMTALRIAEPKLFTRVPMEFPNLTCEFRIYDQIRKD